MDNQPPMSAWLEASNGLQTPVEGSCFFGRANTSNVVLPDDKVSRRHAMVHAQGPDEYWLIDLGSANGTYLNGRRVTQPSRLVDNDRIEIAGFTFTFRHPILPRRATTDPTAEKTIQDIKTLNCWLLVADLESSTQFAQKLPPDEVPKITGRWLSACKQIVEDNAGTINKFLGDGFLAYWVEREKAPDSVAFAVMALKELQENARPRFRIVLHHGKVFVGGGASLGEESLLGNEVNFVFRMEKLASSQGAPCLMSEAANARMKSFLPTREQGRHPLPGFEGEFEFFAF